ncbi:MAG: hypothetical protein PHX18_02280 [Candidatus Gastranaerophilales bacterium]|nr:hypothetical protein [Candidatus Gastranaerophilales bacterium]
MAKAKPISVFTIIGNGTKLYFQNLITLTIPVLAPVLGMLAGLALILLPVFYVSKNAVEIVQIPIFSNIITLLITTLIATIPGFIVFKLAFWNYMLKMVSLNLITSDIIKKKIPKHHSHYTKIISLRTKDYLIMLFIWLLLWIMAIILPCGIFLFDVQPLLVPFLLVGLEAIMIFLMMILSVYLSLSFQVFGFEPALTPIQTLERSFSLIVNNFWRTLLILIVLTIITSLVVPQIIVWFADILMLKNTIAAPFENIISSYVANSKIAADFMIMNDWFSYGSSQKFASEGGKQAAATIISIVISMLMMPLGICYYVLLYNNAKSKLEAKNPEQIITKQENKSKKK